MNKDIEELKEQIETFINKYNISEFKVNIYKLYDKKVINLKIEE